jgi:hypothetical protein
MIDNRTAASATTVRPSRAVVWLAALLGALAAVTATIGLFWSSGVGPATATTVWGQTIDLYGQGLYRHDTPFAGAGARGADAVTLVLGLPLLATTALLYRRGSLRGALLLTGVLTYLLYVYGSLAFGTVVYNELFLAYIASFAASLFALVLACRSIDLGTLPGDRRASLPRRGLATFLFISGAILIAVWFGMGLLPALLRGGPPDRLDSYTTPVTYTIDLGLIMPLVVLAGVLVLRRAPLGYLLACPLLALEASLAPLIAGQTVAQLMAGVVLTPAQIVGPLGGFVVLAVAAIWFIVALLRAIGGAVPARSGETRRQPNAPTLADGVAAHSR